jgi:hypothetical protein
MYNRAYNSDKKKEKELRILIGQYDPKHIGIFVPLPREYSTATKDTPRRCCSVPYIITRTHTCRRQTKNFAISDFGGTLNRL